ncbi:bile acid:sodium symporter family protein [Sesbania bispinosa]|nr:bile acid:sodium symporter family protein [Sesbania bispinosa]
MLTLGWNLEPLNVGIPPMAQGGFAREVTPPALGSSLAGMCASETGCSSRTTNDSHKMGDNIPLAMDSTINEPYLLAFALILVIIIITVICHLFFN